VTEAELKEVITHLAFYAGWPRAMSAIGVAKQVLDHWSPSRSSTTEGKEHHANCPPEGP
jgi:hypothetical protein